MLVHLVGSELSKMRNNHCTDTDTTAPGCMYEFMQGGMLLKPERIFRVFPFREDVPESQREYLRNRVVKVAKQAFDDYFEEQLAKVGNRPEEDRPPSATEDVTKQVDVVEEGNLSETVFARTYFEVVAHRHLMDPHPAFEGFMKCLAMHWIGGFKMIVAGLQESIPEGCRRATGGNGAGAEELVPWDKVFRSPFPLVEARITAAVSKAKGAQDTWDLYMNEKDKNRKNLLWKYHIVPHMTNYAPKTLETLRMMHRGFTGVRAVFGRNKG